MSGISSVVKEREKQSSPIVFDRLVALPVVSS